MLKQYCYRTINIKKTNKTAVLKQVRNSNLLIGLIKYLRAQNALILGT